MVDTPSGPDGPKKGTLAWLRENDPDRYERERASQRAYREAHREERAAAQREWKAANLDRSRQLNRESMARSAPIRNAARAEKREALAKQQAQELRKRQSRNEKNARARERYAQNIEAERERSRRFREEHPEKVSEYAQRYRERNLDAVREHGRNATARYRAKDPEGFRAANREAARVRREKDPDLNRRQYNKDLEGSRARSRDNGRLRQRLKNLELPERNLHRTYAAEKRTNARAADEFFARPRSISESEELHRSDLAASRISWERARRERLTEIARSSPTEADTLRETVRDTALRQMITWRTFANDADAVRRDVLPTIREEIRMDTIASTLQGHTFDPQKEFQRRIGEAVVERGTRVIHGHLESLERHGLLDMSRSADRAAVKHSIQQGYQRALRLSDPVSNRRKPDRAHTPEPNRSRGVDRDR